jgi:uncharacterized protein YceK
MQRTIMLLVTIAALGLSGCGSAETSTSPEIATCEPCEESGTKCGVQGEGSCVYVLSDDKFDPVNTLECHDDETGTILSCGD